MKPTKNRHFCIGCQRPKMLFETQEKADNFMRFNNSAMATKSKKTPNRSYYCTFCCGWHITSINDDEFAKSREVKDGKLWDSIIAAAKGEDLKIKKSKSKVSKPQEKPAESKKAKQEPCEEEKHKVELINQITQMLQTVYIRLNQNDFEISRKILEDSENMYQRVTELIEKHNLSVSRVQITRAKIDKLTSWLDTLVSLQNDSEGQIAMIREFECGYEDRRFLIMLRTLRNREKVLFCVEAVKSAAEKEDHEEARKYVTEIERLVMYGFGGGGAVVNRKWAKQQLALAKKIIQNKSINAMNLQERFLSIIETVERASALLESGDTKQAMTLVDIAQSEINDIEENYITLNNKSICSLKKAALNIENGEVETILQTDSNEQYDR